MLTGAGFLSPAMMLFSRLIRGLLSHMNRESINVDDEPHQKASEAYQRTKIIMAKVLIKILLFLLQELQYQSNRKTRDCLLKV